MGNVEMPMGAPGATLKVPVGTYEFGANLISNKVSKAVAWACFFTSGNGSCGSNHELTVSYTLFVH